jgi:hypothetical protein
MATPAQQKNKANFQAAGRRREGGGGRDDRPTTGVIVQNEAKLGRLGKSGDIQACDAGPGASAQNKANRGERGRSPYFAKRSQFPGGRAEVAGTTARPLG